MKPSVLTITLNPAIDLELDCAARERSDFLKARAVKRSAGGKGVNVARTLSALGVEAVAAVALGGADAQVYLSLIENAGVNYAAFDAPGPTRTNVVVARAGRSSLKINQPGPTWRRRDWEIVAKQLEALMTGRRADAPADASPRFAGARFNWIVISGSLPPGVPANAYARLVRAAHKAGAKVAVDAEGPALKLAFAAKPDLIKPNREELAATFGMPCKTQREALAAARKLASRSGGMVVVSHGSGAAIAADASGAACVAIPPKIKSPKPMGAGDAMLAGMIAALSADAALDEALELGMLCGCTVAAGAAFTPPAFFRPA